MLAALAGVRNLGAAECGGEYGRGETLDVGAELGPGVERHAEEDGDDGGIELGSGAVCDLAAGRGEVCSFAIGAVGGHGVESVGDGEDAGAERDLTAAKAAWVAGAVEALLVGVDDFGSFAEEGDFADHLVTAHAVLAHDGFFFGGEAAGFKEDAVGCGDLSDVVEEGAAGDYFELGGLNAHGACDSDGVGGDSLGVAFSLLITEVEGVAHGFEGDVVAALELVHGFAEPAGAGGDHVFEIVEVEILLLAEASVFDCAGDDAFELGALEGFEEIVNGAAAEGVGGDVDVVDGGEHDDGEAGVVSCELIEEADAVGAGHHDVGEDEVVGGVLLEVRQGLFCAFDDGCGVAAAGEQGGDDGAHGGFIVYYEDSCLRHRLEAPLRGRAFLVYRRVFFWLYFWRVRGLFFAILKGFWGNGGVRGWFFVDRLWWIVR